MVLLDANGNLFRETSFGGASLPNPAGRDGVYFTGDDEIFGYTEHRKATNPTRRFTVEIYDAGADGLWFTPDDGTGATRDMTFLGPEGEILAVIPSGNPGPDGIWLTGDDRLLGYDAPSRDPRVFATYGAPGADGLWFTADDSIERFTATDRDASGRPLQDWYGGPGPDGIPLTADDHPCGVSRYRYLDAGVSVEDGVNYNTGCFHNDNGRAARWQFTRDAQGRLLRKVTYVDAGPDGVWLTEDDSIEQYDVYTYDVGGLSDEVSYYASGADQQWFTDDDTIGFIYIERDNFLAKGERIKVRYRPGADGLWRTADDEVIMYSAVTTTSLADGTTVETTVKYQRRGDDGVWFTADDLPLSTTVKVTSRLPS
jgi:hypothetical protein